MTGGGNSFYSASHVSDRNTTKSLDNNSHIQGMACDTVAGWQLVLANGDIVEANAESNADLWQVSIYISDHSNQPF